MKKEKKIRAVTLIDGAMAQQTIQVIAISEQEIAFVTAKRSQPVTLPLGDILSADYARGDKGEL